MSKKSNKTNIVNIRVTNEEKLNWELFAHAEGMKTSQLARYLLNKYSTGYACDRRSRQEFNRQVARIGNNLNQIARWANTYKGAAEATQVIASLKRIESALLALNHRAG
ncbi:MAG: MobC family plasmid mobilization relaxosome protein [Pleurocapsa sp. MO_192.B19]|nr:MobC family plasmid mobilization relaxosome protein [Pleurocapsa sp. MO_192.B19]